MDPTFRLAAGTESAEFSRSYFVEDNFCDDRTRRIAGAKKQDIERAIGHLSIP
jgi:hypothetical protein